MEILGSIAEACLWTGINQIFYQVKMSLTARVRLYLVEHGNCQSYNMASTIQTFTHIPLHYSISYMQEEAGVCFFIGVWGQVSHVSHQHRAQDIISISCIDGFALGKLFSLSNMNLNSSVVFLSTHRNLFSFWTCCRGQPPIKTVASLLPDGIFQPFGYIGNTYNIYVLDPLLLLRSNIWYTHLCLNKS